MLHDPLSYLTRVYRRYGAISSWTPRHPRHVFAFGPEPNRQLFGSPECFCVDAFRELPVPPGSAMSRLTNGLLKLNGETHRNHRRLMQPAFHSRQVESYLAAIVELAQAELDSWRPGDSRAIGRDLSRLTLRVAMKTIFDLESAEGVDGLHGIIVRLLALGGSPATLLLPLDLPGTAYRRLLRTAEEMDRALRAMIDAKRRDPTGGDVLTALITARDEQGARLTDDELISEAYTAFCHESSAASLTWTLFLLDQHPEVEADLRDELSAALGGAAPTADDLARLPLLDRVLKESLRLFPPAAFGLRYTARPCALGPYELPEGATIFFSQYVTHRIPDAFPQPLRFQPSRWETFRPGVYEYIPFGAGPHHCLGRSFATLEMKIVLAMLLQRYRLRIEPRSRVDPQVRISLVPRQALRMRVAPPVNGRDRIPVHGSVHESVDLSQRR